MRAATVWTVLCAAVLGFASTAAADPEKDTIYCTTDNGSSLGTVDPATGGGTVVGSTGTWGVYGCAYDADGTLYASVESGMVLGTVDVDTGAVTVIGPMLDDYYYYGAMYAIEIAGDGTLYGLSLSGHLFTIDKDSGTPTLVGQGGIYGTMDIAFDSAGTLWAVTEEYTGEWPYYYGSVLYTIDTATGAATRTLGIAGTSNVMSLTFDDDDTAYVMPYTYYGDLFTVDLVTGQATSVGNTGLYYPHGGDFFNVHDADGDGIPDDEDGCPDSDLSATVILGGDDSGVANVLFPDGCTMIDLILEAAAEADNHGQFVSAVAHLTNGWKDDGVISGGDKGKIQACAAKADLP